MSIHFSAPTQLKTEQTSYEQIGSLMGCAIAALNRSDKKTTVSCLMALGLHPEDKAAQEAFFHTLPQLEKNHQLCPIQGNSGAYFVLNSTDKPIAVFKVGSRRAAYEETERKLANYLGLQDQIVPGITCVAKGLSFDPNEDDATALLWNGTSAVYVIPRQEVESEEETSSCSSGSNPKAENEEETSSRSRKNEQAAAMVKTNGLVLGILQPFLDSVPCPQSSEIELRQARLVLALAAAGIADAKKDGMITHKVHEVIVDSSVDNAEGLRQASKLDPSERCTELDMPYLASLEGLIGFHSPLSTDIVKDLKRTVKKWEISTIFKALAKEKIKFLDRDAEAAEVDDDLFDEGEMRIHLDAYPFSPFEASENCLDPHINPHQHVLLRPQVDALKHRLYSLRNYILKHKKFGLADVVYAAYPEAKVRHEEFRTRTHPSRETHNLSPFEATGRYTPARCEDRRCTPTTSTAGISPGYLDSQQSKNEGSPSPLMRKKHSEEPPAAFDFGSQEFPGAFRRPRTPPPQIQLQKPTPKPSPVKTAR